MSMQLSLFADPAPRMRRPGDDAWERGFSDLVKGELVARLNERIGQWLGWEDFRDIRERHKIGCCMGHVLGHLERAGRIMEKKVYYGTEHPGLPGEYKGYNSMYSSALHGPAVDHKPRRWP
jgi:hypothetical protein